MIDIKQLINQFPIYREQYASIDINTVNWYDLPALEKNAIVGQFPRMWANPKLEEAIQQDQIEYMMTSGTSGESMQLIRKKKWWQDEYQRISNTHDFLKELYQDSKRKALFTTAICSNTVCFRENATFEKRLNGNTLHLNYAQDVSMLTREDVIRIITEYNDFSPFNLDADPIYLAVLLKLKEKYGISERLHQPAFISLSYEFCPENCYQIIRSYFAVSIMRMYGSTELGYLYYSVEKEAYCLFAPLVMPKFIPIRSIENAFELVITSLKNEFMPFINYKTGDLVSIAPEEQHKLSDRSHEIYISEIIGRRKDLIMTLNHKVVSTYDLDRVISLFTSIIHYQFDYTGESSLFRYVTFHDEVLNDGDTQELSAKLAGLFDIVHIILTHISAIPPCSSGKYILMRNV